MKTTEKTTGLWPTMHNVSDIHSTEVSEWNNPSASTIGRTLPFCNICETPVDYSIEMAVPGLTKEDFKIEYTNHILTISCKRSTVNKNTDCVYTRQEFSYNSFYRSFTLPETVDYDKIHATYKEGILWVSVAKKTVTSPNTTKAITIK